MSTCYLESWRCDGESGCFDKSDEIDLMRSDWRQIWHALKINFYAVTVSVFISVGVVMVKSIVRMMSWIVETMEQYWIASRIPSNALTVKCASHQVGNVMASISSGFDFMHLFILVFCTDLRRVLLVFGFFLFMLGLSCIQNLGVDDCGT